MNIDCGNDDIPTKDDIKEWQSLVPQTEVPRGTLDLVSGYRKPACDFSAQMPASLVPMYYTLYIHCILLITLPIAQTQARFYFLQPK